MRMGKKNKKKKYDIHTGKKQENNNMSWGYYSKGNCHSLRS